MRGVRGGIKEGYMYRLHRWGRDKESACQCRRHGFNPWVGEIP